MGNRCGGTRVDNCGPPDYDTADASVQDRLDIALGRLSEYYAEEIEAGRHPSPIQSTFLQTLYELKYNVEIKTGDLPLHIFRWLDARDKNMHYTHRSLSDLKARPPSIVCSISTKV